MSLKAGFGSSSVQITNDMLPTFGENYTSIHDLPNVKVMYLENNDSFALVTVGLVMGDRDVFLTAAAKELGIPANNIIIHIQHVLATPHYEIADNAEEWAAKHRNMEVSAETDVFWERDQKIHSAYMEALSKAARQARETLRPARIGIKAAHAKVTVNRVVRTKDGWWQGVNQDGPTDDSVYTIRVDDADGNIMGVVYNVNVAPGCMEFSEIGNGRAVSGDLAGCSESLIEEQLNGAVAMYTTGATGDQWQALRARLDTLTTDGEQIITDFKEVGFDLVNILAVRLAEQIIKLLPEIDTKDESFALERKMLHYPHQDVLDADFRAPSISCRYEVSGEDEAGVALFTMGDSAIVFCGSEVNVSTLKDIRFGSPYANTWLVEFSTTGGGYMPPAEFYDMISYQSLKCHYAKGTAERFALDVNGMLKI